MNSTASPHADLYRLLRLISSSFAVRGVGVACGFALHVILSRTLGPEGAGLFYLGLTLMMAGAAIGKFGLDTALMRFAGSAAEQGDMATVRGLFVQASLLSALLSLAMGALLLVGSGWLAEAVFDNAALQPVLALMALGLVPYSLIWVQSGVLKAVDRSVAATWVESALLPLMMALAIGGLAWLNLLTPARAAGCQAGISLVVWLLGGLIFRRGPGARGDGHRRPWRHLISAALPLALIDSMNFLLAWAIIPILGAVAPESEVGIFNAAHRLSIQLSIVLVVFGGIMGPRFAASHARGDLATLEQQAARTTALMSLAAVPAALVFLGWPGIVGLIFGADFAAGGTILQILAIGQVYNLVSGPAGYVLVMTGHQRAMRNILAFTLLLSLPLIAVLATHHGGTGAAVGVSFGLILQNTLALWIVYRRLGIIGLPGWRRRAHELVRETP